MDYDTLLGGLNAAIADGVVYERRDGDLSLFCYTTRAVYDEVWNQFTSVARGLVLDRAARRIVATPFPKFHNLGEGGRTAPSDDFEAFEKLDGSLIIAFHHNDNWRTATKGEFNSDQAKAALSKLPFGRMAPGPTYLSELIGPSNKIVVRYPEDECRLLGVYADDGREWTRREMEALDLGGMPLARVFACASLAALVAHTATLPVGEEGYVLRFADGTRLKLKGNEYRRLHALISNLSPLTVWDAMQAGSDLAMRRDLPEEFWDDFDQIRTLLQRQLDSIVAEIDAEATKWSAATDKEVGLALKTIPEPARSFLFAHRKGQMADTRTRQALYRLIRPTGNVLDGYVASYAVRRAAEEMEG
ncbi:RNA ligase [Desulfovibrio sp.]|uniref:RNA ligase n=1 Tax=Desulfovibrio sp. TaxID=885 RepID=UPI0025BE9C64|nr:RNA ligase [Desulfovibrio sp.]